MKSSIISIIFLFLFVGSMQGQQMSTKLIKIERTINAGVISDYFDTSLAPFYHGVASGDPLEDAVIIWTRVTTNQNEIEVRWKVATDASMSNVINEGNVTTNQAKDYTVKIDVDNLQPYTTYYYQFEALGKRSVIGKTRTAPAAEDLVDNLRFAIVSCSNYQDGYFNAYNQIAKRSDLDAVIHLGDYIYEYESGGYGYSDDVGRGHVPENEIITLNDYRVRHSYYKLDPMLRNVHQQHAFIHIWDDHEFANDANKFGAENHNEFTEGDWETRKNNAFKAYFEWMPVRANSIEEYRLYRKISYGKLMDLMMLDTRIEGRNTQTNASKSLISAASSNSEFKSFAQNVIAKKDLTNKTELTEILQVVLPMVLNVSEGDQKSTTKEGYLSSTEFDWIVDEFANRVLSGNNYENTKSSTQLEQLLRKGIKYKTESESISSKNSYRSILGGEQFSWLTDQLRSSSAKWRIIGNQVMVMPWNGIPSDDAWDGYEEERTQLLKFISTNNINNVVVLTGDIHSTFVGEVQYEGDCQMCEFVVPSVTSTNLDFLGGIISGISEFYIRLLNRHIKDVDLDNHGYYVLDVREDKVQADWFDIQDISQPVNGERRSRSWYVNSGDCRVNPTSSATVALGTKEEKTEILSRIPKREAQDREDVTIMGVYPMPMTNTGNIHYIAKEDTTLSISLYDVGGKKIQELYNGKMLSGIYNLSFDTSMIQAGTYVLTLESAQSNATRTIIVK